MARHDSRGTSDSETHLRNRLAHGGHKSNVLPEPVRGPLVVDWRPSLPAHWIEQSGGDYVRSIFVRLMLLVQLGASLVYLQYRARFTIGVFPQSREPVWLTLQILFFLFEVMVSLTPLFGLFDVWKTTNRNSVDLARIPVNKMPLAYQNRFRYPRVAVIVPCYKEDTDLVLSVVREACALDYPGELLEVYLCDDGRDPAKQAGVELIRMTTSQSRVRVHYVTRPDNRHAKPGNVNHCVRSISADLVLQLDADFLVRPNMLQRLVPYFLTWDPHDQRYAINDQVAFVQTPQFYRNLSPFDHDPLDQRNSFFFSHAQRAKDWFNGATMVGTANLISRPALHRVGYFPVYTSADDTALSLLFHAAKYRSYYVHECVATGLAPPTLRGHFGQRSRWQKSDFEILFSKHGPLRKPGLSFSQRIMYCNVCVKRFRAITAAFFDASMLLVLIAGFIIVDVRSPIDFTVVLLPHLLAPLWTRIAMTAGNPGVHKTLAASDFFDAVFRYSTLKVLLCTLFRRKKGWKVAEKKATIPIVDGPKTAKHSSTGYSSSDRTDDDDDELSYESRDRDETGYGYSSEALRNPSDETLPSDSSLPTTATALSVHSKVSANQERTGPGMSRLVSVEIPIMASESSETTETGPRSQASVEKAKAKAALKRRSATSEKPGYFKFVLWNLKRCWYNVVMFAGLTAALVYSVIRPPDLTATLGDSQFSNYVPLALAYGYTIGNLIPHVLVISLCFKRHYIDPWDGDPDHERCDGWVDRGPDKAPYVPLSYISFLAWIKELIVLAAVIYTIVEYGIGTSATNSTTQRCSVGVANGLGQCPAT